MDALMTNDYIYWAFSAASQSISAFIAFLLTGYALVHSMMEAARDRDDSLDDVHNQLKSSHHRWLTVLAWLTGCAIVLSLVVVYLNKSNAAVSTYWQAGVALLDLIAIVGGLWFVVSIVDPAKYEKAAKKVLDQEQTAEDRNKSPASTFFSAFLHLERLVREYLRNNEMYIPSKGSPKMSFSFRQMIDAMFHNEKIGHELYDELLQLNKYRNLVFHGHVTEASSEMVQRAKTASEQIENLAKRAA